MTNAVMLKSILGQFPQCIGIVYSFIGNIFPMDGTDGINILLR